jgi:hypothetical protein
MQQPVKITPLSIETYSTIDPYVIRRVIFYLSLDSSYITDDLQFQSDVQDFYTELKWDAFANNTWFMTRVVDYKLLHTVDPITQCKRAILPADFVALWQGYDKHIRIAPYIYNLSYITAWNTCYISYRRYIRDDDPIVRIPTDFKDYIAVKLALELNLSNRYKVPQFDRGALEVKLGSQKQKALVTDLNLFNSL